MYVENIDGAAELASSSNAGLDISSLYRYSGYRSIFTSIAKGNGSSQLLMRRHDNPVGSIERGVKDHHMCEGIERFRRCRGCEVDTDITSHVREP